MTLYYQCRLEQKTDEGIIHQVAWIEEKGAKHGLRVQLIGEEGLWEVKIVSQPGMNKVDIHNHQTAKGLKSIHFSR